MEKTFLLILLFISVLVNAQSNNYELFYDSSSKRYIRIELDAVEFAEWVNDYWIKKGDVWVNKRGEKLTSKKLWLYWYKETNQCWWE